MFSQSLSKYILKLRVKKHRREYGEFLVEGIKGVEEALKSKHEIVLLLVEGKRRDEPGISALIKQANTKSVQVEYIGRKEIGELKTTEIFPGVMAVVKMPEVMFGNLLKSGDPIVCLDKVSDPGNLGTIIRTCDWFGFKNIILSEDSVEPYNEKCVRSTMGSIFNVNIYLSTKIVQDLEEIKKQKYIVRILDLNGKDLNTIKPEKKSVYVFGSESHGVSDGLKRLANEAYTIKGAPNRGAESLNVAVSAAVVLSKIPNF